MRKFVVVIVLCIIGTGIGAAYSYWEQVNSLPDWYVEPTASSQPTATPTINPTSPRPAAEIQATWRSAKLGPIQAQLSGPEIDNLIVAGLSKPVKSQPGTKALPPGIKTVKTQIAQNSIRTGMIVDLGEITAATSPAEHHLSPNIPPTLLTKIRQLLPQLHGQKVYIGVSGNLSVKNQQLQLSPDSKLQVGKVEFGLDEVAQKLGFSRPELERQLTSYLQLQNLNLQNIDLTDHGAVITGEKK